MGNALTEYGRPLRWCKNWEDGWAPGRGWRKLIEPRGEGRQFLWDFNDQTQTDNLLDPPQVLFGFSNVCYMPLFVPSVLIFLPPLYTILICHCSQLLYHPSIKLKGLQLVIVVASYTQHGLWSWVPTANQLSNPTRRSFVIKDRWMYHILQPHFRLIVADERWTLSQNFPFIW